MKFIRIASPDIEIKRGNNKITVEIDGNEVRDIKALYDLLTDRLSFPGYFGENLDALYDMLVDLQWLKHDTIELIIFNYHNFLADEDAADKADLMLLLEDACREWKEGDFDDEEWEMKKFRVIVACDQKTGENIARAIDDLTEEE